MLQLDDGLLPVLLAPASAEVRIAHQLALLAECIHLHHGHVVKFLEVLTNLGLAQKVARPEVRHVVAVRLRGAEKLELMRYEVDLSWWLLEARSNRRL